MIKYKNLVILGAGTLLFFGVGGILIIELYLEKSFVEEFTKGWNIFLQVFIGIIFGLVSSLLCLALINRDFFKNEKKFYVDKIAHFELNYVSIILISLCAGIGEEIFFRAAIQPILGVIPTAIIFVVLHGYISFTNWRISIYGLLMIIIMIGFGYLYETAGLLCVIMAHTVIDIVLFVELWKAKKHDISYRKSG